VSKPCRHHLRRKGPHLGLRELLPIPDREECQGEGWMASFGEQGLQQFVGAPLRRDSDRPGYAVEPTQVLERGFLPQSEARAEEKLGECSRPAFCVLCELADSCSVLLGRLNLMESRSFVSFAITRVTVKGYCAAVLTSCSTSRLSNSTYAPRHQCQSAQWRVFCARAATWEAASHCCRPAWYEMTPSPHLQKGSPCSSIWRVYTGRFARCRCGI